MRALVTGGIGFIRTNPSDRLLRDGHGVVLFDNVSRTGVQLNFDWLKGQLTLGISYSQMHDSSAYRARWRAAVCRGGRADQPGEA